MLKNLINKVLANKGMSINQLSQILGLTYANTHALVNREDLSETKLGTLVDVSKALKVEITDLYQPILANPHDFREVRILDRAIELIEENSKTGSASQATYDMFYKLKNHIEEYGEIDINLVGNIKDEILKSAKYTGYTNDVNIALKRLEGEIDTHFDKDNLKIITSAGSGNTEYDYRFFQDDFEEWAIRLDLWLADTDHLREYLTECGYKVLEIIEQKK